MGVCAVGTVRSLTYLELVPSREQLELKCGTYSHAASSLDSKEWIRFFFEKPYRRAFTWRREKDSEARTRRSLHAANNRDASFR
jgi:hypothetical protein